MNSRKEIQIEEVEFPSFSTQEISKHNTEQDLWIIIKGNVYDITKFLDLHPAGRDVLLQYGGQDTTEVFNLFHPPSVLNKYQNLIIGTVQNQKPQKLPPLQNFPNSYGNGIPYADPGNVQGMISPFYTENHKQLRLALREWIEKEIVPNLDTWEENNNTPREVMTKVAEQGIFNLIFGPPMPNKYYHSNKVCGVPIENQNMFHQIIFYEEINRVGSAGLMWAIVIGVGIGLPPIVKFGSEDLKKRYVPQCLSGEHLVCLAITEPWGGSDVASLRTTAKKTPCGKFYIVNGMKKFISNAIQASAFSTAVRTGGKGDSGISMIVIDRHLPGVRVRKMKMMGGWTSGTSFIMFDNVKVPAENLIGKEGEAFKYIMVNFNHERLQLASQAISMARCAYEESMKFVHRRKTFGKYMIEHPVIRNKLGHMIRQIEASQAFLEVCTYNYDNMPKKQSNIQLSGTIALLKAQSTQTMNYCISESVQIFGGQGIQRLGAGGKIERLYRDSRTVTIGGGSEEIMIDLGVRQASKLMPSL